jgi:hypothetical protein
MLSKYQTQLTLANEQITEMKTKISASEEMQRLFTIRLREITTLISRKTIGAAEKDKLTKETDEIKDKLEA